MMLSVSDVVKLALAGVKVDLNDIKGSIDRDENLPSPPVIPPANVFPRNLEEAFWDRWRRAHLNSMQSFYEPPYGIYAHEFAETVYVMVCPRKQAPFIIEDRAPCYPSDALMAALSLYESTNL
jgi:hypothetical protein